MAPPPHPPREAKLWQSAYNLFIVKNIDTTSTCTSGDAFAADSSTLSASNASPIPVSAPTTAPTASFRANPPTHLPQPPNRQLSARMPGRLPARPPRPAAPKPNRAPQIASERPRETIDAAYQAIFKRAHPLNPHTMEPMNWNDAAEDFLNLVVAQTPRPIRETTAAELRALAESMAEEDGKNRVGVETVIAAWVRSTPETLRADLPRQMERYGLDPEDYRSLLE
jgi:hypothetical protein